MSKKFKILVPKPATANKEGTEVKLYKHDEIVDANIKAAKTNFFILFLLNC